MLFLGMTTVNEILNIIVASDIIIPCTDSYVVKSQIVERNEPFFIHGAECI